MGCPEERVSNYPVPINAPIVSERTTREMLADCPCFMGNVNRIDFKVK